MHNFFKHNVLNDFSVFSLASQVFCSITDFDIEKKKLFGPRGNYDEPLTKYFNLKDCLVQHSPK